ncbi:MAG: L-fuculose phosphate aldolase [Pseudomonadota bacterium]|jgi:L-fuculose-phosphate aldolase
MSREALLNSALALQALGLNQGTSGNASVRHGHGFLITPSGMPIDEMNANNMVEMNMHGEALSAGKPSSEWRFHRDIYQAKPEVGAVIHTHSMFATTLACLRKDIPPFHYMIAVAGGDTIRCATYALFGTQALSDHAIEALKERRACLLANHGMITVGKTLQQALDIAKEVETLCEQYWRALQIGEPHILSGQEMQDVFEQFKGYGNWNK